MPILGFDRFKRMLKFTKTVIPKEIFESLEPIQGDDEKVQAFGVEFGIQQTKDLIAHGFRFIHYYTMNLEASIFKIIDGNGTMDRQRSLPFTKPTCVNRAGEEVRPIFWSVNPKSYISKTTLWDNFPNGRWGNSRSPAYKAEEEGFVSFSKKPSEEKHKMWGLQITNINEVSEVFKKYVSREIKKFPFSEGPLNMESDTIREALLQMNAHLMFTINSQPAVNGVKSSDPVHGWGPERGYIY